MLADAMSARQRDAGQERPVASLYSLKETVMLIWVMPMRVRDEAA